MNAAVLEVADLVIWSTGSVAKRTLVDGIDLAIRRSETFTLIGETGSGKTLLAQAVTGTLPGGFRSSGSIRFQGTDLLRLSLKQRRQHWGRRMFLLPQEPEQALDPTMRVDRQVEEVFRFLRGRSAREARREARRILEQLKMSARSERSRFPCQLSGGMNQRILFAMALSAPAELIVADEPTKGLDAALRNQAADLLGELRHRGKTLFCITHDLYLASRLGGRVGVMFRGRMVESGPAEQVLENPSHPFTRGLIRALPRNGLHPIPVGEIGNGEILSPPEDAP